MNNYPDIRADFNEFDRIIIRGTESPDFLLQEGITRFDELYYGYEFAKYYNCGIHWTFAPVNVSADSSVFNSSNIDIYMIIYHYSPDGQLSKVIQTEMTYDFRNQTFRYAERLYYDNPDDLDILLIEFNGSFDESSEYSTKFDFTKNSHSLSVNGKSVHLDYTLGTPSTPLAFTGMRDAQLEGRPPSYCFSDINMRFQGGMKNFIILGNGEEVIKYPMSDGSSFVKEMIQAKDSEFSPFNPTQNFHTVNGEGVRTNGLPNYIYEPTYREDVSVDLNRFVENPFKPLPDGFFDKTPTDEDLAFLVDKTTGEPLVRGRDGDPWSGGPFPYPSWVDVLPEDVLRNPNLWCKSKDITCCSVLAQLHAFKTQIILISPRHGLIVEHVRNDWPNDGVNWMKIPFMDMDSNIQTVNTIDHRFLGRDLDTGELTGETFDTSVVLFNEPITLDVNYAKFMSTEFSDDGRLLDVQACGHSKEGLFCLEKTSHFHCLGLPHPMDDQPEYLWSRFHPDFNYDRTGDSGRGGFVYNGDELLYFGFWTSTAQFPYQPGGRTVRSIGYGGHGNSYCSGRIEDAMEHLDIAHGYTEHYKLVRGSV